MYPFYERLVKWSKDHPSIVNLCIHKGLFPPLEHDRFAQLKEDYQKNGADRNNLTYGYIYKPKV